MTIVCNEKELERRDRRIAQLEDLLRRRDAEIATLEKKVADLEAVLKQRKEANASKKPRFVGDFSLRTQERKVEKKKRRKRSPGRRRKEAKLDQVEKTIDFYPKGVPHDRCTFSHDRLAWRLKNGRAVRRSQISNAIGAR